MDNVTEADKLGPQVLDDLFKSMPSTKRGIAIGIANQTSHKWSGMNASSILVNLGQMLCLNSWKKTKQHCSLQPKQLAWQEEV